MHILFKVLHNLSCKNILISHNTCQTVICMSVHLSHPVFIYKGYTTHFRVSSMLKGLLCFHSKSTPVILCDGTDLKATNINEVCQRKVRNKLGWIKLACKVAYNDHTEWSKFFVSSKWKRTCWLWTSVYHMIHDFLLYINIKASTFAISFFWSVQPNYTIFISLLSCHRDGSIAMQA